jgi:hypothetical protein
VITIELYFIGITSSEIIGYLSIKILIQPSILSYFYILFWNWYSFYVHFRIEERIAL